MPGCGMRSRPKLAEKARNNSLLKIVNNNNNNPREQLSYTVFIDTDPIYSHQGKWGGGQNIFSFHGMALQQILEKNSYRQYMSYMA